MHEKELQRIITLKLLKELAGKQEYVIPAGVSGRHVHLKRSDVEALFGAGYKLNKHKMLSQSGQFACEEKVSIVGAKGKIDGVRILGPERNETQVEISKTDSYKLGIKPVVRISGDIANTPGCTIIGPAGEIALGKGVIVAARHLHMSAEEAKLYGLKNGDIVSAVKKGDRETTFGNILVRSGEGHALEVHIDTDEANAAGISSGDFLELIR